MELKCMTKRIDQVADLWNKTRDPKYKDLWYKLIKEMHGLNNLERRTVSIDTSNGAEEAKPAAATYTLTGGTNPPGSLSFNVSVPERIGYYFKLQAYDRNNNIIATN